MSVGTLLGLYSLVLEVGEKHPQTKQKPPDFREAAFCKLLIAALNCRWQKQYFNF